MKTIILATDFSPAALNAANYAADMALSINGDMLLLNVLQAPVTYSDLPFVANIENIIQLEEKDIDDLREQLKLRTKGKVKIETEMRMGGFFSELKMVCEQINPYVVVMGSQGTTAADHLIFGSHAVHATKHLMWPLITVPPGASFSAVKKIGLASDLNEVVETTPVDEIRMLVKDFKAELHILNIGKEEVFEPGVVSGSGMMQEMLGSLDPKYHFISNENIDEGILEFTDKNQIDLLIVLPKRHGLIDKLIHKSHTKQLVLHSHVPVMALHQ